jgi:hypothetical protein
MRNVANLSYVFGGVVELRQPIRPPFPLRRSRKIGVRDGVRSGRDKISAFLNRVPLATTSLDGQGDRVADNAPLHPGARVDGGEHLKLWTAPQGRGLSGGLGRGVDEPSGLRPRVRRTLFPARYFSTLLHRRSASLSIMECPTGHSPNSGQPVTGLPGNEPGLCLP